MAPESTPRLSTGIVGLDEVLYGGLIPERSYMVRGGPGTGKTILGWHFLTAGSRIGQKGLLIGLGEPEAEMRRNAAALGFDLQGVEFLDLSPTSDFFTDLQSYDIFSAAEVEREPTIRRIHERVTEVRPQRVLVDGMTQLRYLSTENFHFRKQILAFLRFLTDLGATVMFTSESSEAPDEDLQFIADGVIDLAAHESGRSMRVIKYRGSDFRGFRHSLRITNNGTEVFPRLVPEEYGREFVHETMPSGLPELDAMLNGGIERGTITLLTGPSGVGKSTLGLQFMRQAARHGERCVVYLFEEWVETLLRRCESVNIPVGSMIKEGTLSMVQVEPLRFTADQFARLVRSEIEERDARFVMIDSIAGYRLSLRGEDLVLHLHALTKYLQNMGVTVLLINEVEAITGDFRVTEIGVSYLADNIIFMRYLELGGEMCKALGVLKKRLTDFEKSMRQVKITSEGFRVGEPLTDLRGILVGRPEWIGAQRPVRKPKRRNQQSS